MIKFPIEDNVFTSISGKDIVFARNVGCEK
jgi:hypothetical protein